MKSVCIWSNEPAAGLKPLTLDGPGRLWGRRSRTMLVLPEHEAAVRRYMAYAARFAVPFTLVVLILAAIAIVGAILRTIWLTGTAVALLGALSLIFPFTSEQTIGAFGIRRSITIARVIGVVTLIAGLAIMRG